MRRFPLSYRFETVSIETEVSEGGVGVGFRFLISPMAQGMTLDIFRSRPHDESETAVTEKSLLLACVLCDELAHIWALDPNDFRVFESRIN